MLICLLQETLLTVHLLAENEYKLIQQGNIKPTGFYFIDIILNNSKSKEEMEGERGEKKKKKGHFSGVRKPSLFLFT